MRPAAPDALLARATEWEDLTRWERAELGRALRRLGWSFAEIRDLIPVPKSTLSGWCSTVQMTQDQIEAIRERTGSQAGVPRDTQWRRREEREAIARRAASEVTSLARDPLWVAGTTMYWAEGSKTSNRLALTNSDPAALRLFIDWTRLNVDAGAEFVLALHLHHGNDEKAARNFWRRALRLPDVGFQQDIRQATWDRSPQEPSQSWGLQGRSVSEHRPLRSRLLMDRSAAVSSRLAANGDC